MNDETNESTPGPGSKIDSNSISRGKSGRKYWFIFPNWQFKIIDVKFQFTIYAYFFGLASLTIGLISYWTKGMPDSFLVSSDFIYLIISLLSVFGLFAGVLSHKLVGPLYNMRKHMVDLRNKNTTLPLRFRQDDFFLELCDEYNQLIESYTDKNDDDAN